MDKDARLKQFAASLFAHVYRGYNTTFDLPVKLPHVFSHHAASECSEEEARAVTKLCLSMRNVFNGLFVRFFPTFQRSTQHFMTFLTSRCLKLCAGDDVFLSFAMVCAFIAELNLFCLINGCFAFMGTAPKCLQAIFNRRLRKEFYASGGWESLRFFSEHFAQDQISDEEDVVSADLLANVKERLDEDSSEDEDSESGSEEDIEDVEEEEEDEVKVEIDAAVEQVQGSNSAAEAPAVESDDTSDSESGMDSDDSSDSDEEESENEVVGKPNGLKKTAESDSEESEEEEGEVTGRPNGLKPGMDSDDDSDSSEESDPSTMSDEESESEDSESDAAPSTMQTNCIKPIMQENLNVDKKVL